MTMRVGSQEEGLAVRVMGGNGAQGRTRNVNRWKPLCLIVVSECVSFTVNATRAMHKMWLWWFVVCTNQRAIDVSLKKPITKQSLGTVTEWALICCPSQGTTG